MLYLQFPGTTAKDLPEEPAVLKKASHNIDIPDITMGQMVTRNMVIILPWSSPVPSNHRSQDVTSALVV